MTYKLLVFISGNGTNLQAIIDACSQKVIDCEVIGVVSNRKEAYGLIRAQKAGIPTYYKPYLSKLMEREDYDKEMAMFVKTLEYDLIVLAGWMYIFGENFLLGVDKIINLHPALPNQFAGKDAIHKAFIEFKKGNIKKTGIMVHKVVKEVDGGEVIEMMEIPIFSDETEETLCNRIHYFEKPLLIKAINTFFSGKCVNENKNMVVGKVRDMITINNDILVIKTSDRQSAFDRYICDIFGKGQILTNVSAWWFEKTKDIIDNHYLYHIGNIMVVRRCVPIKIEVVVRGYITGATKTSLWTHYQNGEREYCGHIFRDGLIKNEKLERNIITPTTKGEIDEPISGREIVERGLLGSDEWQYVKDVSLKLFEFGQRIADEKGLILVDTKYEFGRDNSGKIILIDELHTCDSSRYWLKSSYIEDMSNPQKFDKDLIREWIRERCNPYEDELPEIPNRLIEYVGNEYKKFEKFIV